MFEDLKTSNNLNNRQYYKGYIFIDKYRENLIDIALNNNNHLQSSNLNVTKVLEYYNTINYIEDGQGRNKTPKKKVRSLYFNI